MLEEFVTKLIMAFAPIAAGLIGLLILEGIKYLQSLTKSKKLKEALDVMGVFAKTVVNDLNQTLVDDLKEKAADGKLTVADAMDIKANALERLKTVGPNEAMKIIEKETSNLESVLSAMIEEKVIEMKW